MNEEEPIDHDRMDEEAKRIAYLMAGFIGESLTTAEHDELDDWVTASMENQKLFEQLTDPSNLEKWSREITQAPTDETLKRIKTKVSFTKEESKLRSYSIWPWLVAAAALLLILSIFFLLKKPKDPDNIPVMAKKTDIDPGGKHARLRVSSGENLLLDTVKNGRTDKGKGNSFVKEDGMISYDGMDAAPGSFNELMTPAGGEFQVVLSDGTKVWLNAMSSLKYPVRFSGNDRTVDLTGEGYFEVAKDAVHPFIVKSRGNTVLALGTHFDVNAYTDQDPTLVTLAEGSVRLNDEKILKPGEQGTILNGDIKTAVVDLEPVLAWTKGEFLFRKTAMETVMDQLSHWYDAKIIYQDNISVHFNGSIPRNVPVSKVLHLLESTGSAHFKIEDKTITVMK
jgi:transmembrane sensor